MGVPREIQAALLGTDRSGRMITHERALELWYGALAAEVGIAVPTDDINYLCSSLYSARAAEGDSDLQQISLVKAKGEVWLVKTDCLKQP